MDTLRIDLYAFAKQLNVLLKNNNMTYGTKEDIIKKYFKTNMNDKLISKHLDTYYDKIYDIISFNVPPNLRRKTIEPIKGVIRSCVDTTLTKKNYLDTYKNGRTRLQTCFDILEAVDTREPKLSEIGDSWLLSLLLVRK